MTSFGDDLNNQQCSLNILMQLNQLIFMDDLRTSQVEVDGITIRQDLKGELDSLKPDLTISVLTISIREENIRKWECNEAVRRYEPRGRLRKTEQ